MAVAEWFVCPFCGHDRYCVLTARPLLQCNRCRRQCSVTARTPLQSTKLPPHGVVPGPVLPPGNRRSARHRGGNESSTRTPHNTPWRMRRKLQRLMNHSVRPLTLDGSAKPDEKVLEPHGAALQ